jgi:predicted branched-subunit amino acid permease
LKESEFSDGVKSGIPIALGYFSVSFSFGMLAVSMGLPVLSAVITSMTNVTSAGQASGLTIMAAGGTFLELIICQAVINLRYALMSLTISQRLPERITFGQRLIMSFMITDEIFAVMASREKELSFKFYLGLASLPFIGWSMGTFLGALFGNLLPDNITAVLGIALYGMFVAIIIPPAKKSSAVMVCIVLSAVLSSIIYFVPVFSFISSGISVIICALIASCFCAWKFPIKEAAGNE